MFQGSLSIQLFGLHSPSTCSVQNFQIFTVVNFFHTYTLHTCFKVHFHTVIWFTLSKHMLGLTFSNFHERSVFMLTLSTHVSGSTSIQLFDTLQAQVRFKIFKFSREIIFSCLQRMFQDSLSIQLFGLHSPITC